MDYLIKLLFLLAGVLIGLNFADIDQQLPFLLHRSILTHGFLAVAILYGIARSKRGSALRLFTIGVGLASAIHLAFDLFPRSWRGYALITVPGYGRTGAAFSWFWIALSVIICLYLAFTLIEDTIEIVTAVVTLFVTFSYCATTENVYWLALIALVIASIIALKLPPDPLVELEKLSSRIDST